MSRPSGRDRDLTTVHVDRALAGDSDSLGWVIRRFTPLLLAQVRYRLSRLLQGRVDPEDIVQDVWLIAIPKFGSIVARDRRLTPVLLRFLVSIANTHYRTLLGKHVQGKPLTIELDGAPAPSDEQRSVLEEVLARELRSEMLAGLDELEPADREIVILRAIEGAENQEVAALLGISPNLAAVRYHRAVQRLRERVPESVFDDIDDA